MTSRIAFIALIGLLFCSGALAQDKPEQFADEQWAFVQKLMAEQDAPARQVVMQQNRSLITQQLIDACVEVAKEWASSARLEDALRLSNRAEDAAVLLDSKPTRAYVILSEGDLHFHNASDNVMAAKCYDSACTLYREIGDKDGEAACCFGLGHVDHRTGNNEAALKKWDQALLLYREVGNKSGEANCHYAQGSLYAIMGQPAKASGLLEKALTLYEEQGQEEGQANCRFSLAHLSYLIDDSQAALAMCNESLRLYRATGNKLGQANCYGLLADICGARGDNAEAMEVYAKALGLYRVLGDKLGEARVLAAMADRCFLAGQTSKALDLSRQAMGITKELGNPSALAACLNLQADIYAYMKDNEQALEALDMAVALYRQTGIRAGEANCCWSRGNLLLRMGQAEQALDALDRGLSLYVEVGDRRGEANCYLRKGDLRWQMGEAQLALDTWGRALSIYLEIGDKLGQGNCYQALGDVYFSVGEDTTAAQMWDRALAIFRDVDNIAGKANCCFRQGNLYSRTGDAKLARASWGTAMAAYRECGDRLGESSCLGRQGESLFSAGEFGRALELFQEAGRLERQFGLISDLCTTQAYMARLLEDSGDLADSEAAHKESVGLAESLISTAGSGPMRVSYGEEVLGPHVAYAAFLSRHDRFADSFAMSERAKGRMLVELTSVGGGILSGVLTPDEKLQEKNLFASLSAAQRSLSEAAGSGADQETTEGVVREVERARSELRDFLDAVYVRHPELRVKRGEAKPLEWENAKSLLGEGDAFLEYTVGDDFFVVYAGCHPEGSEPKLTVKHVECKEGELESLVALLRGGVTDPSGRPETAAKRLYTELVEPVRDELKECKRLLICPDGVLCELPFQALMTAEGKYLLQEHEISYAPSITAWNEMTKAAKKRQRGLDEEASVLAVGVSDFGERGWKDSLSAREMIRKFYSTERAASESAPAPDTEPAKATAGPEPVTLPARGTFTEKGALSPLPSVPDELEALSDLLGPACEVVLGSAAQEAAVKEKMPQYRILHFASHGLLDQWQPFSSAIALADPKANAALAEGQEPTEDGFLEAREILGMELNADLAVLSCCQTALGKRYRGEGIVGLSWAFFAAGCPSVVASQWVVDDESTAVLMEEFYRGLLAGKTKAEALRSAQLQLLESKDYSHPFHWAPFILIGDRG